MPNVLIVNKSSHDFSKATRFGPFIFMSDGQVNRLAVNTIFRSFQPHIEKSAPDDYLLLTGFSILNSIACAMFAQKHSRLNLLLYKHEPGGGDYIERTMNLLEQGD